MTRAADPLVSTKLRPSQARPKLVARPRLVESLTREPGRRLTLLSAPAGFGKTTLLNEWVKSSAGGESCVAWLSLDEGDNDPARFLSYLVAALRRTVEEGFGEGVLAALRSPQPPRLEALAAALINEMADLPGEVSLVLDDYHLHRLRGRPRDRLLPAGAPAGEACTSSSRAASTRPCRSRASAPGARWSRSGPPSWPSPRRRPRHS